MILWEIARATGIVAVVVYTLTATWGILLAGRGIQQPKGALELHRALQGIGLAAILLHVAALLLDSHAGVGLLDVLGIGAPVGIVLGAVAFWLAVILPVSFALRTRRRLSFRLWRWIHYLAYGFWGAAVAHGIVQGSDTDNPVVLGLYGAAIALVAGATFWRIFKDEPQARTRAASGD
jgi:sulfoxide reductase heme-binding subunit YedZ